MKIERNKNNRLNGYIFRDYKAKKRKIYVLLLVIVVILILLAVYLLSNTQKNIYISTEGLEISVNGEEITQEKSFNIKEITQDDIDEMVDDLLESMSISDKVSQLIFVTPEALVNIGQVVQAEEATKNKLQQYPVGGILFAEKNFETVAQLQKLINSVIIYSQYPLLIGVDEEAAIRIDNTKQILEDLKIKVTKLENEFVVLNDEWEDVIIRKVSSLDGATQALISGSDLIVIDSSFEYIHKGVLSYVEEGKISMELIDNKIRKVLEYKILDGLQ